MPSWIDKYGKASQAVVKNPFPAMKEKRAKTQESDVAHQRKLAIALAGRQEPQGLESGEEIPKELGGLPLKSVKAGRGGRNIPTYGKQTTGDDLLALLQGLSGGAEDGQELPPWVPEEHKESYMKAREAGYSDDEIKRYLGG